MKSQTDAMFQRQQRVAAFSLERRQRQMPQQPRNCQVCCLLPLTSENLERQTSADAHFLPGICHQPPVALSEFATMINLKSEV